MSDLIYLDHAAATPLDERVFAGMQPYLQTQFYNPSATYQAAREIKKDVEAARARVAHWFGARPSEITFTAGGTEANNLAIHGIMSQFPEGNIVVSAVEHDSVLASAGQYEIRIAPVLPTGLVDVSALEELIDDNTVLVSVMYANNELGTIQPIKEIATLLQKKRNGNRKMPLYLHVDACQATPYLDLHASRLGVDLMTINGSKMYGPKQSGALYVRAGIILAPLVYGGGQEHGLRSGTENVANIVGLAAAIDLVQTDRHQEVRRLQQLQQKVLHQLAAELPGVAVNGTTKQRLPNNIHITIPGQDNERLMMLFDEQGIQVAVGSACSASSEEPSHVLKAIGLSDAEAQASLRITMGHSTDEAAMQRFVTVLGALL